MIITTSTNMAQLRILSASLNGDNGASCRLLRLTVLLYNFNGRLGASFLQQQHLVVLKARQLRVNRLRLRMKKIFVWQE